MKKAQPKNFEEAMARLEKLTQDMQAAELPLEEALAAYEEGQKLLAYCRGKLELAEQKLQILDGDRLRDWKPEGEENREDGDRPDEA